MRNKTILPIIIITIIILLSSQVNASDTDNLSTNEENIDTNDEIILESQNLNKEYGSDEPYEVNLHNITSPLPNEKVTITVNGVEYNKTTNQNGTAKLNINLNPGTYGIQSAYANHTINNIIKIAHICGDDLRDEIYITGDNYQKLNHESGLFKITLVNKNNELLANQEVTFTINRIDYKRNTDENGIAKLTINLNTDKIPVYIRYNGNTVYRNAVGSYIITTQTSSKTECNLNTYNLTQYYGENKNFKVQLTDKNHNPIQNQKINFKVNEIEYSRTTDENGTAKLPIRLPSGIYSIKTSYEGNSLYDLNISKINQITVIKNETSIKTTINCENLESTVGENKAFNIKLTDENQNPLVNQNIQFKINGKTYSRTTDEKGNAKVQIRLTPGTYTVNTEYEGNALYCKSKSSGDIRILDVKFIKNMEENSNIQNIIDTLTLKSNIRFAGSEYYNISLNITKKVLITTNSNSTLKGKSNSNVLTLNENNITIKNLNINPINGSGIVINNAENTHLEYNHIYNQINESNINQYELNKTILKGNGIEVSGSKTTITGNTIEFFKHGIYLENAKNNTIKNNRITKNNYGIEFNENVSNTDINTNNITCNIGWLTLTMVEGQYGYGLSIRKSGVNLSIINNKINDNYMGIFIDAKNCTGINICGNEISYNIIEGLTVNENYSYATGDSLNIENNALYNNAKGPSLMILGEVSANPAGIYGPGEFNDSLKLVLGPNWYGTTIYTTWGENNTGAGTICPRIKTTLISFNLTYLNNGSYKAVFYNNGKIASELPDFNYYMTLNYYTPKEEEIIMNIALRVRRAIFLNPTYSAFVLSHGFSICAP